MLTDNYSLLLIVILFYLYNVIQFSTFDVMHLLHFVMSLKSFELTTCAVDNPFNLPLIDFIVTKI